MQATETNTGLPLIGHTPSEGNPNNSDYLIEQEAIEGTPFTMVSQDDNHFIVWGKYRLSPPMEKKEHIAVFMKDNMWDLIGCWMVAMQLQSKEYFDKEKMLAEDPVIDAIDGI